jgi:hypothetical protein
LYTCSFDPYLDPAIYSYNFFSILGHLTLDPDPESGSGSGIRIRNPDPQLEKMLYPDPH